VRETVAAQLLRLNSEFYQTLAAPFAATRARLQPGVLRAIQDLSPDASVLDIGCGSGALAHELARRGHRGRYLGVDSSAALLAMARRGSLPDHFRLERADFSVAGWQAELEAPFTIVFGFAVLHHIPGWERRLRLVKDLRALLQADGSIVVSTWDFLASNRLRGRIQPWESVGLSDDDVDPGDYLLDWRQGGAGLRYVHHFRDEELQRLAAEAGLETIEAWTSDGEGGRLGLYRRWAAARHHP
jgi:SAM-dependent methyltransferase